MATVGQSLTAPEAGWRRYDDMDSRILTNGTWTRAVKTGIDYYKTTRSFTVIAGDTLTFKFYGTKLRIIGVQSSAQGSYNINVDAVDYGTINQNANTSVIQRLDFEKLDLSLGIHSVKITNLQDKSTLIDAVDIDDTGYLVIPIPSNLTATAGDSQVSLLWDAVSGATGYNVKRSTNSGGPYTTIASGVTGTSYVDTDVTNDTTYYYVVTAVDAESESDNSNEASATPVAPGGYGLLRVTMIDSSDREYDLPDSDIEGFINWFNSHADTDTKSYTLNKSVGSQLSKEYLVFDKIISFEVIELTK